MAVEAEAGSRYEAGGPALRTQASHACFHTVAPPQDCEMIIVALRNLVCGGTPNVLTGGSRPPTSEVPTGCESSQGESGGRMFMSGSPGSQALSGARRPRGGVLFCF